MKTVEAKVVVLGSQGVGKTSLVIRFIGKMFHHHISPTIGASFFTCKVIVKDIKVKLQVWDTAGQERFRSMAPMYYRNANAALLVFDITQYHTFTSVKYWVTELKKNVEEPMVICLIGNKSDLAGQRKVAREEAVEFATTIGGLYFESSALQDQGIDDVFFSTAEQLIVLANDPNCTTVRVFETNEDNPFGVPREVTAHAQEAEVISNLEDIPHGEPSQSACC